MGYTVTYNPRNTHRNTKKNTGKKIRKADVKRQVRWNLPRLEHDTQLVEYVDRDTVIHLLRLDKLASYATAGTHALQQLISEGVVLRPTRVGGVEKFKRDDLIAALKTYTENRR